MDRLEASLTLQSMNHDQGARSDLLRTRAKLLAEGFMTLCEDCRERSIAITRLEESLMWAIKSIALEVTDASPEAKG